MEVLNRNQRKSAIWKLLALSVFILVLVGTGVFAMHNSYASQGEDEIVILKKELKTLQAKYEDDMNTENGKYRRLDIAYQKCLKNDECSTELEKLNKEIEDLEKERDDLEKDVEKWEERYTDLKFAQ